MVRTTRQGPDAMNKPLLLLESVGWELTPHAAESFRQLRRDPAKTCNKEVLRALLTERGIPAFDAALDFEARCGGVDLGWRGSTFGTHAAMTTWERRAGGDRLTESCLLEHRGELLLPIAFDEDDSASGFWMDAKGVLYYDEDLEETCAFASSASVFLERVAFLMRRGRWHDPRFTDCKSTLVIHQEVGRVVAEVLGIPLFSAATDAFGSTWYEPARALILEDAAYRHSTTITAALDTVVAAARVVAERAPSALAGWRGNGAPPAAGEIIAARLPRHDPCAGKEVSGEILFVGTPGHYRAHQLYHEAFRYLDAENGREGA